MSHLFSSSPHLFDSLKGASMPPPLNVDRWVAASMLQKAIRRGDVEFAKKAVVTLWAHRGPRVWARLVVIAIEDVGLGNLPAIVRTVRAARSFMRASRQSSSIDPMQAAVQMAIELSVAPKDRSADYLASLAIHDASLAWFRSECLRLPVAERIAAAVATDLPLCLRAVAAWTAGGLAGDSPLGALDRGDRAGFFRACLDDGVPHDLIAASADAATMTREPICLFVPLLWSAWSLDGLSKSVAVEPVPTTPCCHGVPLWALDKHTRAGKIAMGRLSSENGAYRAHLSKLVGPNRLADVTAMVAYYFDAAPIARRLDWPQSHALARSGRIADMAKVGVSWDQIDRLVALLGEHHDRLNALRAEMLGRTPSRGERT